MSPILVPLAGSIHSSAVPVTTSQHSPPTRSFHSPGRACRPQPADPAGRLQGRWESQTLLGSWREAPSAVRALKAGVFAYLRRFRNATTNQRYLQGTRGAAMASQPTRIAYVTRASEALGTDIARGPSTAANI